MFTKYITLCVYRYISGTTAVPTLQVSWRQPARLSFPESCQTVPWATRQKDEPPPGGLRFTLWFRSRPRNELGAGDKGKHPSTIAAPTMTTDEAQ